MCFLENEVLGLIDQFIPLQSTHTQSLTDNSGGAPTKTDTNISESGEKTRENDSNANK
jgi:hypothetical protein